MARNKKTAEEIRDYNRNYQRKRRKDTRVQQKELKSKQRNATSQSNRKEYKQKWREANTHPDEISQLRKQRRDQNRTDSQYLISNYEKKILEGPTCACCLCNRIWFPSSVVKYQGNLAAACENLGLGNGADDSSFVCRTCKTSVLKKKIPTLAGPEYQLPPVPEEVKLLNCLELQLISERLPFMKILTSLRGYGQKKLQGNIVNIPLDIETTTSVLPRSLDKAEFLKLKLKRRLDDKNHYLFHNVNVNNVWKGLHSLIKKPLYSGITMDTSWLDAAIQQQNAITEEEDDDEEECFDKFPLNGAMGDTMVQRNSYTSFAPGQGRNPIRILRDKNAEEKSFPNLFGGEPRKSEDPIKNYTNHIRSELMNVDRRFAADQANLFYKVRVQTCRQIENTKGIFCRRKAQQNITAAQALDDAYVNSMVDKDEGYSVLKSIISSPAHWKSVKDDLMSMIRQVGRATWFLTLSPAETDWLELIRILYEMKYKTPISDEELSTMSRQEKSDLINGDPVVVVLYLNRRYREIFKIVEKVVFKNGILHRFKRVEYQMKGSAHEHHMLFAKCPDFDLSDPTTFQPVCDYIDNYVKTSLPAGHPAADLLKYQTHNHTSTCFKTNKDREMGKCRFGIPYPPMAATTILLPLTQKNCQDYLLLRKKLDELRVLLNSKTIKTLPIAEILEKLDLTHEDYLRVIRVGIKRETVFLRRKYEDRFINAFNETILTCHRANHDLQFVLSTYSCANYLVNYVGKSQKGISKTLRELYVALKDQDLTVQQRINRIGYAFNNAQEISCHEAVYTTLGLPQSYMSTKCVYVSTNVPEDRVRMLKTKKDLQALKSNSRNVFARGFIENYALRARELESVCLACFATQYTIERKGSPTKDDDEKEGSDEEIEGVESSQFVALDKSFTLKKLKKQRILRYKIYKEVSDPINFYRSNVFLFLAWRSEETDVNEVNCQDKYFRNKEEIQRNRKLFNKLDSEELETAESEVQRAGIGEDSDGDQDWVPDDRIIFDCLSQLPEDSSKLQPIQPRKARLGILKLAFPKMLGNNEISEIMSHLNVMQRDYAYHYAKCLRQQIFGASSSRLNNLLLGQAGVGKSFLTKAITQITYSIVQSCTKTDLDLPPILLSSFTGKSAFAINGTTLHSLFGIAGNLGGPVQDSLSESRRNSFRAKFLNVKTLIIDEISMVSKEMFLQIHRRLEEIFGIANWGGLNVLLMGELFQLNPVAANAIFKPEKTSSRAVDCVERDVHNFFFTTLSAKVLWDQFQLFELTEIMRQKDDLIFALALNRLGTGQSTLEDFKFFQSLQTEVPHPEAIHLFATNADVDQHNNNVLDSIDSDKSFLAEAQDFGGSQDAVDAVKSRNKSENDGLANSVLLKPSAVYMVIINIDLEDGLYNGAQGRLIDYEIGTTAKGNEVVTCAWLKFDDPIIGKQARLKCKKKIPGVTPIFTVERTIKHKYAFLRRRQIPIIPCAAISVHKSQGGTFDHVAFHIPKRLTLSLVYVACSRAKTSAGLYIIGNFPDKLPQPQKYILDEMKALRDQRQLKTVFNTLQHVTDFSCITFNIRSLSKYVKEIENDPIFQTAEIIFLQEPRSKLINLKNFQQVSTSSNINQIVCYVSNVIQNDVVFQKEIFQNTTAGTFQAIKIKYQDIVFVGVYSSPKFPTHKMALLLEQMILPTDLKIIVQGDFNYDFTLGTSVVLNEFLKFRHLNHFITEPTTDHGSCLDNVLSNLHIHPIVYESVTSDHRPILTRVHQSDIAFAKRTSTPCNNIPSQPSCPFDSEINHSLRENRNCWDSSSDVEIDFNNARYGDSTVFEDYTTTESIDLRLSVKPVEGNISKTCVDSAVPCKKRRISVDIESSSNSVVSQTTSTFKHRSPDSSPLVPQNFAEANQMAFIILRETMLKMLSLEDPNWIQELLQNELLNTWETNISRIPNLSYCSSRQQHCDPLLLPRCLKPCLKLIQTEGNGSCFFNAASINLIGNQNLCYILRLLCVKQMCVFKTNLLATGLVGDSSWQTEVRSLCLTQETCTEFGFSFQDCFSDACTGLLLSQILRRPIYIIRGDSDVTSYNCYETVSELSDAIKERPSLTFICWSAYQDLDNRPPVVLMLKDSHYTGCIRKNDNMIFVPPAYYRIF